MTTEDPITHACRLLRGAAQELARGVSINGAPDWANEPVIKAAHDEAVAAADALAALASQAQPAPQQEAQEPVAWQSRTRPTWGGNDRPWSPWESCTKGLAEDCWKTPLLHDWAYEARALYTAPLPSPAAQEDAPLSDPLQGAANWLVTAHSALETSTLAGKLSIGYNRAKRLHDAALAAQGGTKA